VNGRSTVMFHQEGTDAMVSQQQGRGKPDKAAADDQDRHLDFIHGGHISKNGPAVARGVLPGRAGLARVVQLWIAEVEL
jgi:hypothetical protein